MLSEWAMTVSAPPPKKVLCGELTLGKCRKSGQQKYFKDILRQKLTLCSINCYNFEDIAKERPEWRATISKGCKYFKEDR